MIPSRTVKSLDGLRGLAMLMVLAKHGSMRGFNPIPDVIDIDRSQVGSHGVFIFFALSAFLLTRQFLLAPLTLQTTTPFLFKYFYRRVTRIYPLYVISILAYWTVGLIAGFEFYGINGYRVIQMLFFYNAAGFYWTIPVEFAYYMILPVVAFFLMASKHHLVRFNLIFVVIILCCAFCLPRDPGRVHPFLVVFLMGSYAAYLSESVLMIKRINPFLFELLGIIGMVGFFLMIPSVVNPISDTVLVHWFISVNLLLPAFFAFCMILGLVRGNGRVLNPIFENRILRFCGKVSFSAYLGHMFVLDFINMVVPDYSVWIRSLLFIGLTLTGAYLSYRMIEVPVYKSKRLQSLWDNMVAVIYGRAGRSSP